jgi:hypothetical protein
MTQLFWPFSPSPSKKAAPAVGKASASQLSSAAKSSEHGTASNMDVKAVRQAQEVMRKLVMEDKKAARKRAEETVLHSHDLASWRTLAHSCVSQYIKDLVAQHIKEAKMKAQAKLAAAKAAILKAKVDAAKAANLKAKVASAKAAIPKAKSAADAQAKASSTITTADAVVVRKTDSRVLCPVVIV